MEAINNTKNKVYGTFFIGDLEVAVSAEYLNEVINFPKKIIQFPLAPAYMMGLITLRDEIIPVIDISEQIKVKTPSTHEINMQDKKIAIVNYGDDCVGFVFDKTNEVLRPQSHEIIYFNKQENEIDESKVIEGCLQISHQNRIVQILKPEALVKIKNIPHAQHESNYHSKKVSALKKKAQNKKCISFFSNHYLLAFDILDIDEIIRPIEIRQPPIEVDFCIGVFTLRDQYIPLIDLRQMWLSSKTTESEIFENLDARIIILSIDNLKIGLLVNKLSNIHLYESDNLKRVPLLVEFRKELVQGYLPTQDQQDLILLSKNNILNSKELEALSSLFAVKPEFNNNLKTPTHDLMLHKDSRQTYITFKITHLYGMRIAQTREILDYKENLIVQSPGSPHFVKGIMNLRHQVVTIIDTRLYYGIEDSDDDMKLPKIIVIEKDKEFYGLIVDSVDSIITEYSPKKFELPHIIKKEIGKIKSDVSEVIENNMNKDEQKFIIILDSDPIIQHIKAESA